MRAHILILPLALLAACGDRAPGSQPAERPARLVKAMQVGAGDTTLERRYSGEVRARHEVTVGFRVGGKITQRLVDAGARVRQGQPLARLDPADARLAAAQAEANRTLAAAELKRAEELRARNFISRATLDARETAARSAEAQAQLANNQAAYATLTAEQPGIVAAVLAEPGQVVSAGQAVFRLARDGEREISIAVPENRIADLRVGAAATINLWAADRGRGYKGVVREITPAADPASRTFAVRISIVDADAAVALGMSATVALADVQAPRLVVPLAALLQKDNQAAVWVIGPDHTVSQRPVGIERFSDAGAVVRSGLDPGERIVAAGAYLLAAGEKVRVAEDKR